MCPVNRILLPHDADGTEKDGSTFKREAIAAGMRNVVVVPQCRSVWQGIGELSNIFETSWFHSRLKDKFRIYNHEGSAWDYLNQYRVEQVPEGSTLQRMPKKDHTSHCCDAARTFAEAKLNGLLTYAHAERRFGQDRPRIEVIGL
jgi:Zn-finger nucleic acid-binding protein